MSWQLESAGECLRVQFSRRTDWSEMRITAFPGAADVRPGFQSYRGWMQRARG